jgi:hypothetical protein
MGMLSLLPVNSRGGMPALRVWNTCRQCVSVKGAIHRE